jgi:hypothetical protein
MGIRDLILQLSLPIAEYMNSMEMLIVHGNNFCHITTPELHTFLENKYGVTYTYF